MKNSSFLPSDLLLPQNCNMSRWSVIASDQYINQEDYWQNVEDYVSRAPSSLRMILPESCLDGPDMETDIMSTNSAMSEYLRGNIFQKLDNALIYVERKLNNGQIRQGIVGMIDLEVFDYDQGAETLIRASELTSSLRIPPRVATRKNASLELSHAILLADDKENQIFSHCSKETPLYDFDLMEGGGHISGWLLSEEEKAKVIAATDRLGEESDSKNTSPVLQFAVGDGNHSLATAKECYERQKKLVRPEDWANLPARYAMVELVNLHQDSVVLSPFHRVISGVDCNELLRDFRVFAETLPENDLEPLDFHFHLDGNPVVMTVKNPRCNLEVFTFQDFLAQWNKSFHLDYVHSEDEAQLLGKRPNTISIILPEINKEEFFPTLISQGILPKKSFSLGMPKDKRFYLEARKIR